MLIIFYHIIPKRNKKIQRHYNSMEMYESNSATYTWIIQPFLSNDSNSIALCQPSSCIVTNHTSEMVRTFIETSIREKEETARSENLCHSHKNCVNFVCERPKNVPASTWIVSVHPWQRFFIISLVEIFRFSFLETFASDLNYRVDIDIHAYTTRTLIHAEPSNWTYIIFFFTGLLKKCKIQNNGCQW